MGSSYLRLVEDDIDNVDLLYEEEDSDPPGGQALFALSFEDPDDHPPEAVTRAGSWAKRRRIPEALAREASVVKPWLPDHLPAFLLDKKTVKDCLEAGSRSRSDRYSEALAHAARSYLALCAQKARLTAQRRTTWTRSLAPRRAQLAAVLLERYRSLANDHECLRPAVFWKEASLVLRTDPPSVTARFRDRHFFSFHRTELRFAGFEQGRIATECSCGDRPCRHIRVMLEAVLDALYSESSALGKALEETASVPTWRRLMTALEMTRPSSEAECVERLAWRIGVDSGRILVQPVLQKRRSNSGWSVGRKVSVEEALHSRVVRSTEDRLRLEDVRRYGGPSMGGPAAARFLLGLVGHPWVFAYDPPHCPLNVDERSVRLAVDTVDDGVVLWLAIGDRRVSAADVLSAMVDERHGVRIDNSTVELFELPPALYRVARAVEPYDAHFPREAYGEVAEMLYALSADAPVELPAELRGEEVPAETTPFLRLAPQGDGLRVELRVRPLEGQVHVPGVGPVELYRAGEGRRTFVQRDMEAERAEARALSERLGLSPRDDWWWALEDADVALDVVHAAQELGDALAVEWLTAEAWKTTHASLASLRVRVNRTADWFGMSGDVEVDGGLISLASLLMSARAGRRYVQVGPGRFARIEAKLAAASVQLDDVAFGRGKELVPGLAALEALDDLGIGSLDYATEWSDLRARMERARNLEPEIPNAFTGKLRPYQVEGYRWLARLSAWDAGCCLVDDMGLGKTIQTLALLLSRGSEGPSLVVAPTSVGPNWIREAEIFTPSLRVRHFHGPNRAVLLDDLGPHDVLVTSYDVLVIDAEALREIAFDVLVLDEAQAVKNARTRRAKAARAMKARFKLALTGTPVENHLGELWSIFSIVSPGVLGPWEHFKERFAGPIERERAQDRLEALSRLLRPFMLRRTKRAVAPELPPRTEVTEIVELSREERALYEAARLEALDELVDSARDESSRIHILAALTRLRRLACHPRLVASSFRKRSSKLDAIVGKLVELREAGQRALVFSQFTGFLAFLRTALDRRAMPYLYLDGRTPARQRQERVNRWHDDGVPFFLISLKAGGTGLNLTGADCVLHLDPWWNPAVEDQATDRTHRIGQRRPVTVVRLVAQGTIEEAVLRLHGDKRALAEGLLHGTEVAAKLSSAELVDLIRFGEVSAHEPLKSSKEVAPIRASELRTDNFEKPERGGQDGRPTGVDRPERGGQNDPPTSVDKPERGAEDHLGPDDLTAVRGALQQHLAVEVSSRRLAEGTSHLYLRVFDWLLDFAQSRPKHQPLKAWCDECVAEVESGAFNAPLSLRRTLPMVTRRVAKLPSP